MHHQTSSSWDRKLCPSKSIRHLPIPRYWQRDDVSAACTFSARPRDRYARLGTPGDMRPLPAANLLGRLAAATAAPAEVRRTLLTKVQQALGSLASAQGRSSSSVCLHVCTCARREARNRDKIAHAKSKLPMCKSCWHHHIWPQSCPAEEVVAKQDRCCEQVGRPGRRRRFDSSVCQVSSRCKSSSTRIPDHP